ncbi:MAG: twin transmembrane helix small protein [Minwuia sp.]|nr:twin transmembrane helix small protein [Minwuia sp.]
MSYIDPMAIFEYLAIASVIAVAIVLATGVISMISGSDFGKRNSNRLMRARILFQALAILFLALAFLTDD